MADLTPLIAQYRQSLLKAVAHLEYSYNKVKSLPKDPNELDEETLETWESFTARLARVVDLYTSKYIQARVKQDDPGFEGSLRDFVNQAEKLSLLDSADEWMAARGLRNITAHEYKEDSLKTFFQALLDFAPLALKVKDRL